MTTVNGIPVTKTRLVNNHRVPWGIRAAIADAMNGDILMLLVQHLYITDCQTEKNVALINKTLDGFREAYMEVRNAYPGDSAFYKMLYDVLLQGSTVDSACAVADKIIKREISFLRVAARNGFEYQERFLP